MQAAIVVGEVSSKALKSYRFFFFFFSCAIPVVCNNY